jgi:hypothetical protein
LRGAELYHWQTGLLCVKPSDQARNNGALGRKAGRQTEREDGAFGDAAVTPIGSNKNGRSARGHRDFLKKWAEMGTAIEPVAKLQSFTPQHNSLPLDHIISIHKIFPVFT